MNVKGAEIDIRSIVVGDNTLSVLEIWGAEYQEQVDDDYFLSRVSGIENLTRLHSHSICLDFCFDCRMHFLSNQRMRSFFGQYVTGSEFLWL